MTRLYVDDANDAAGGHEIFDPSSDEFKVLIIKLNGDTHTLVTFGDEEDGWYLAIGGAPDRAIAYISYLDD